MTRRGRAVLVLGVAVYVAAWVFGSPALDPVATGLVFAVLLALVWVRASARAPSLRRHGLGNVVEGADVRIRLEVAMRSLVPPPTLVAVERAGRLPEREVQIANGGGRYVLPAVRRGRYVFDPVRLSIEDPFGLARVELVKGEQEALVVYPQLVDLSSLFSEGGSHAQDGRRLLMQRPTGYELHSVREHMQGESLRAVHWPSTARRGRLMVKELEDAPRDEVVVLLDGTDSSTFDLGVRAAGSILRTHVRRGRRCALVINSSARPAHTVTSPGDWHRALELLASAEADGRTPLHGLLQSEAGAAARALELVVVTSRVDGALTDRLVQRALSRRGTSLVHVGGATEPQLLRLQSAGIPIAVVRPGDDLVKALAPPEARVA